MRKLLVLLIFLAPMAIGTSFAQNSCDSLPRIEQADITSCPGAPVTLNVRNYFQDSILAGFNFIGTYGGNQYYASNGAELWEDAKIICEAAGGHLVTCNSSGENAFVGAYNPTSFYWIGYFQNLSSPSYSEPSGGWEWVTGEPTTFTGWASGEPNQNSGQLEDYTYMNFGGTPYEWNDAPSNTTQTVALLYILEIENPYAVLWSTGETTDTITVNPTVTTTYYVTTSDSVKSCYDSVTVYVNDPDPGLPDTIAACSPSVDLTAASGYAAYAWSTAELTPTITVTASGIYGVVIQDSIGCTGEDSMVVSIVSANIDQVDTAICTGGTLALNADSAVGNTFIWSTSETSAGISVSPTASTMYTVIVSDGIGACTDSVSVLVSDLQAAMASQNISCAGSADGMASITVTNGIGAYTYLWNTMAVTSAISGLAAATYTVDVTDSIGCVVSDSALITEPNLLFLSAAVGNVLCFGDSNGTIDLTATGGTFPYLYSWSTGDTIEDLANLLPGPYSVSVTDTNGCQDTLDLVVAEPAVLSVGSSVTDLVCNGDSSGTAIVSTAGGTAPFSYMWNDPGAQTTANAAGLAAGSYTVVVTDSSGCMDSSSVTVNEPPPVGGTFTATDAICNGNCDGSVTGSPAGGTGTASSWMLLWNTGDTALTISGLCAGMYNVLMVDSVGCSASDSVLVSEPVVMMVIVSSTDATCNGDIDGTLSTVMTGGNTPFTYSWTGGLPANPTHTGVSPGSYTVTVTDSSGCTASDLSVVSEPAALVVTVASMPAPCTDYGELTATPGGGTLPYSYLWNDVNSQTTATATDLASGTYSVTVTDVLGCPIFDSAAVITGTGGPAVDSVTVTAESCIGAGDGYATVYVSGGIPPYAYTWDDPNALSTDSLQNLLAGAYSVVVMDAQLCTATDSVYVEAGLEMCPVEDSLNIPSSFTPNGDLTNDTWILRGIDKFPGTAVEIYSRWGSLLYNSNGYAEPWDGTYNGVEVASATYYYIIVLGGDEDPVTGSVTIVR
jgi:gliding motility-associated-like protein